MVAVFRAPMCIAALLSLVSCVKRLPPPPMPAEVIPAQVQASAPPAAGTGRLVVDVVEGPAPVQRVHMDPQPITTSTGRTTFRFDEKPTLLCEASPCISDMAPGNVLVGFPVIGDRDAWETELIHVGPETNVYRRSLSVYNDGHPGMRVLGIIMTSVGGASLITGTTLLPIGLSKSSGGLTTAGAVTLGAGALLLTVGILTIRWGSATYRPGSVNHFVIGGPMQPMPPAPGQP